MNCYFFISVYILSNNEFNRSLKWIQVQIKKSSTSKNIVYTYASYTVPIVYL